MIKKKPPIEIQIKNKARVRDHGEVFTNEREIMAMLKLVKNETIRIDSKFLEPACGDGNFLTQILLSKMNEVSKKYSKNRTDFEKYTIIAVGSLYGIDIMKDNVLNCRNRLFEIVIKLFNINSDKPLSEDMEKSLKHILKKNIVIGDGLTMKTLIGKPIIFSDWALVTRNEIQKSDYIFSEMLKPKYKVKEIVNLNPVYESINETIQIEAEKKPRFIKKELFMYNKLFYKKT
jgi:hypothetical protein